MNGFRKLQARLREEGWYVGWNHYCCQSCGWMDVPDEADLSKVLFNHSQDCEYDWHESVYQFFGDDDEKCEEFFAEYEDAETKEDKKWVCARYGALVLYEELPEGMLFDGSFVCYPPEQQTSSLFCFSGDEEGVKNLTEILPIIEECGCHYNWSGTGNQRIEISW